MRGDGVERMLCHYVGGAWRAPLSVDMDEAGADRVVLAGAADLARALRIAMAAAAVIPPLPPVAFVAVTAAGAREDLARIREGLAAGQAQILIAAAQEALLALDILDELGPAAHPAGRIALLFGRASALHACFAQLAAQGPDDAAQ